MKYDYVIIGGGHNGLVTATFLARAGKKVLVLEKNAVAGGAVLSEELFPGFLASPAARDAAQFSLALAAELKLHEYGLELIEPETLLHAPTGEGDGLTLWRDVEKACASIRRFSERDARRYPEFLAFLQRMLPALQAVLEVRPPDISALNWRELLPLIRPALKIRGLGKKEMMEFLRILPMTIEEFLSEWFESDRLKGALAVQSITGTALGAQSAGTCFLFLYHSLHSPAGIRAPRFVRGGMGRLAMALRQAAEKAGAEVRCGAEVRKIQLHDLTAAGVELAGGEQITAKHVISAVDPKRTFFQLLGAEHLPVAFVRAMRAFRQRGVLARLELAVEKLPLLAREKAALGGHVILCPDLDSLEKAYDATKYGRMSEKPCLDLLIPTLSDPSLAPEGQHLLSINAHFAPHTLREGEWDEKQRRVLQDRIFKVLEAAAPGFSQQVLHTHLQTPADIEQNYGMTGGDIFHGQMALDQLFVMRPVPGWSRYSTPIRGLFLCAAGTHPGGGVTGMPGRLAAQAILAATE